jgi:hypothetical protein
MWCVPRSKKSLPPHTIRLDIGRSRTIAKPPWREAALRPTTALVPPLLICYIHRRCLDAGPWFGIIPNAVVAELVDALA